MIQFIFAQGQTNSKDSVPKMKRKLRMLLNQAIKTFIIFFIKKQNKVILNYLKHSDGQLEVL